MPRGARRAAATSSEPVEGPWELPEAWRWERLGDLGKWYGGGTPSKDNPAYWTGGSVPWVSPKDMKSACIDDSEDHITEEAVAGSATKMVPSGSVLCVMRSGILRHSFPVAVNRRPVTLNQDLRAVHPRPDVNPTFLANYLRRAAQDILHECSKDGTTVNSIETDRLLAWPVPVARPDVQERIVTRIDALFAEIEEGEQALAAAREGVENYRKALLKAAVTGELTADWRKADPPSCSNKSTAGLPASWIMTTLGDLIEEGPQNGLYVPRSSYGSGTPIFRIDDFRAGQARPASELKRVSIDAAAAVVFGLAAGDIVINRVNSPAHLGKCFVVADRHVPAVFESNMMRVRFSAVAHPAFVELYLRSEQGRRLLTQGAKAAVNQSSINQGDVRRTPIPLPPKSEQLVICERVDNLLDSAGAMAELVEGGIGDTSSLRQSILAAAFRGELVS